MKDLNNVLPPMFDFPKLLTLSFFPTETLNFQMNSCKKDFQKGLNHSLKNGIIFK